MPTPFGTSRYPSFITNGLVISFLKYRDDAEVSPGKVNPGKAAKAKLAALPIQIGRAHV